MDGANLTVSDADSANLSSATATITNLQDGAAESLAATVGTTGITANYTSATGVLTLSGSATLAQYQQVLRTVRYSNTSQNPGTTARSVNFVVSDGTFSSNTATSTVAVNTVNDAPTLTATAVNPTYTENGAASDLFNAVNVSTIESGQSIDWLLLTVGNVSDGANEVLNIDGTDVPLVNGTTTTVTNGMTVTVSVTGGTASVTITKTAGISTTATQTLVDGITYRHAGDNPSAGIRAVTLTSIRDTGGTSNGGADTTTLNIASAVTVAAVNDTPVVTNPATINVTEDAASVLTGISISDADAGNGEIFVTLSVPVGGGTLSASDSGGVTVAGSGSRQVTLSGTTVNIDAFIAASRVTFTTANNATASVTLATTANDGGNTGSGGAKTDTKTTTLNVSAVNDAPVNSVPGDRNMDEDTFLVFSGAVSASDVDAAGVRVTLGVTNGKLTLSQTTGLTFTSGGNGQSAMTFTGTLANINTALDGMRFDPNANYSVASQLTIITDDLGNTGSGGGKSDTDVVNITINPVNDRPVADADGPYDAIEDTTLNVNATEGVLAGDTDIEGATLVADLLTAPARGTLTLELDGSFSYAPTANDSGSVTFEYRVCERDSDPLFCSDPRTVTINIAARNDAPDVTFISGFMNPNESSADTYLYTYSVSDVDGGPNQTITPDCGSGGTVVGGQSGDPADSFRCCFPEGDENTTVSITVDDGSPSNAEDSDTIPVTVDNVAPAATLANDGPRTENSPVEISFTNQDDASDPDVAAGLRYEYNCDGSEFTNAPSYATASASATTSCALANSGTYPVLARLIDKDGGASEYTTRVVIQEPPVITINDVTIVEGSGSPGTTEAIFTLRREGNLRNVSTVDFATANGTAQSSDYESNAATVTFGEGQATAQVRITVNDDETNETNETFFVNLSEPSNATVADGDAGQGTTTIVDDDTGPVLTINDATVAEGGAATFTISLSEESGQDVTVDFATGDRVIDPATAGDDYDSQTGSLTFQTGETTKTVVVQTRSDVLDENDETFFVNLSNPTSSATIGDGRSVGTIRDDDPEPTVSISGAPTVSEGDAAPRNAAFTVYLSGPSGKPVTVQYATRNGSATEPGDYAETSDTISFAPGETSKTIDVPVADDALDEDTEDFFVDISGPINATLSTNATGTAAIQDDDAEPSLSISNAVPNPVLEGDTGTNTVAFTVTLSEPSGREVSVNYARKDGTAAAGSDYVADPGTLVFEAGQTTKTITMTINGDTLDENDENFYSVLSGAVNASILDARGEATIQDDDTQANLSVAKIGPSATLNGQPFNYTITVTNGGPSAAQNVVLRDNLPDGMDFNNGASTADCELDGSTLDPNDVICTLASLGSDDEATFTINVTPHSTGTINNTASATSDTDDPTPDNTSGAVETDVNPAADIQVTKTGPTANPINGQPFDYTITVKNNGPDEARNVVVTDDLPFALDFNAADSTPGCDLDDISPDPNDVRCTLATLASGATKTFTINVTPNRTGPVSNTASGTSETDDPVPGNGTSDPVSTTVNPAADLSIQKAASDDEVNVGEDFTYSFTITNNGPDDATGATVTDVLPTKITYLDSTDCSYAEATRTVTCGPVNIAATATRTFDISVETNDRGSISNTAAVDGDQADPNSNNDKNEPTVITANGQPTAVADTYTLPEGGTLTADGANPNGVLSNDSDPEGSDLDAQLVSGSGPDEGTLDLEEASGAFTYEPPENFAGQVTFEYRACDASNFCSEPVTVTIDVTAVNDAPDLTLPDGAVSYTENSDPEIIAATATVSDVDLSSFDTGTLTVGLANNATADDRLAINNEGTGPGEIGVSGSDVTYGGTIIGTFTGGNGVTELVITFDADATPAAVEALARNITFANVSDNPSTQPRTVSFVVTDGDGGTSGAVTETINVMAVNDAPSITNVEYSTPATEGSSVTITVTASDLETPSGELVYSFDCDNDDTYETVNVAGDNTAPCTFGDWGTYVVGVRVFDGDKASTSTVQVVVENADPTVSLTNPATTAAEGETVTYDFTASDPGNDTLSFIVDCGAGEQVGSTNFSNGSGSFQCRFTGRPDDTSVTIIANDGDSGTDESSATISISNVAPNYTAPAAQTAERGQAESISLGSFKDPGADDPWTVTVEWGDGDTETFTVPNSARLSGGGFDLGSLTHNYAASDEYTVRVTVAEIGGNPSGSDTFTVTVQATTVPDPPTVDLTDGSDTGASNSDNLTRDTKPTINGAAEANSTVEIFVDGVSIGATTADQDGDWSITLTDALSDGGHEITATAIDAAGNVSEPSAALTITVDNTVNTAISSGPSGTSNPSTVSFAFDSLDDPDSTFECSLDGAEYAPCNSGVTYEDLADGEHVFRARATDLAGNVDGTPAERTFSVAVLAVRDDFGSTGEAAAVSNAYISQYISPAASAPTRLYGVDTARNPYTLDKIGQDIARPMNAIGYRSTNRSLYGYRMTTSPGIVKVNPATGSTRYLGTPAGLPASGKFIAGDVSPNGSTYYLYTPRSSSLWKVNINTFQASSVQLSSTTAVSDFAVSPTGGILYGVDKNGKLLRINPWTGKVTSLSVAGLKPGSYGAAWFTAAGDLIAYENGTSSTSGTMVWIGRPTTTEPIVVSKQAAASTFGNDGAAYVAPPNPAGLSVEVDVLANDGGPGVALDRNTLRIVEQPTNGTVLINANKTITYTSGPSYRGTDSFRYEVCDNGVTQQCGVATVNITSAPIMGPRNRAASRKE